MRWTEVVGAVAARTGLSSKEATAALDALSVVVVEALARGDVVALRGIGRLEVRELAPRAIRRIDDRRKYYLGRRRVVRFRAAAAVRRAVEAGGAPWREPSHQAALRAAHTLVSDLALYHPAKAPQLGRDLDDDATLRALSAAFGALWERAERAYASAASEEAREGTAYLIDAARREWTTRPR